VLDAQRAAVRFAAEPERGLRNAVSGHSSDGSATNPLRRFG